MPAKADGDSIHIFDLHFPKLWFSDLAYAAHDSMAPYCPHLPLEPTRVLILSQHR